MELDRKRYSLMKAVGLVMCLVIFPSVVWAQAAAVESGPTEKEIMMLSASGWSANGPVFVSAVTPSKLTLAKGSRRHKNIEIPLTGKKVWVYDTARKKTDFSAVTNGSLVYVFSKETGAVIFILDPDSLDDVKKADTDEDNG